MRVRSLVPCAICAVVCVAAQAQTPTITGVANNAAPGRSITTIAPGELVNVNGSNLGDSTQVNCGSANGFTSTCGTVSVMVAGKAAGVRNENATVLIIQVPVDAPLGSGSITVTHTVAGTPMISLAFNVTIAATAPQMYATNMSGTLLANCFDGTNNNVQISIANPASPGDTVGCIGTGFGVTNPVIPTGHVSSPPLPNVVANVTATLANANVSLVGAFLQGPIVGEDLVLFVVPVTTPPGNQPLVVNVGGLTTLAQQLPISGLPKITSVESAASQIAPGLPNGAVAQGSIILILGANLGPATLAIDPHTFQDTSFSGTSLSVTVNGTTVSPLLYYTAGPYVAALLPSNTPVGTGTITATYNNQVGNAFPITVVANNLGIFTYTEDGQGIAIVTYPNYTFVSSGKAPDCGTPLTSCGAANPGDVLIIWATGLGPISGSDAGGDGLAVNMPNIPVQLWLGGVSITPSYQGRSGCCIGEDQIVFKVPDNVMTGCAVPLFFQIGNEISNNTVIPVAPSGSRECIPSNPAFGQIDFEPGVLSGPVSYADLKLKRNEIGSGTGYVDSAKFQFVKILTYPAGTQAFFSTYVDNFPLGSCEVFNNLNPGVPPPAATTAALDAGSSFTITGPNGSQVVAMGPGGGAARLSAAGTFLSPGNYTIAGNGGADVGKFQASVAVPTLPAVTSPSPNSTPTITRANGMTFTWNPSGTSGTLLIFAQSATDNTQTTGATAACYADPTTGTFTIPASAMLALPPGSNAGFQVSPVSSQPFTASGLNLGIVETHNDGVGGSMTLQ